MFKSKPQETVEALIERTVGEQLEARVAALVDERVETAVSERLAVALPELRREMADEARRALPGWIRMLPLWSRVEFAAEWVKRHGEGFTATIDLRSDDEKPTFYRDGTVVPLPAAHTGALAQEVLTRLAQEPWEQVWRSSQAVAEGSLGVGPGNVEFERTVARVLIGWPRQGHERDGCIGARAGHRSRQPRPTGYVGTSSE